MHAGCSVLPNPSLLPAKNKLPSKLILLHASSMFNVVKEILLNVSRPKSPSLCLARCFLYGKVSANINLFLSIFLFFASEIKFFTEYLFELVVEQYPNTDFALDATFKLEFIEETLAAKEMYIARYYLDKEKWIPAINRFKEVVEKYNDSVFIEEALHRLVEIHYKIGLEEEAKKYAYLLGYNYQSSQWYENTYKVFNKNYSSKKKKFPKNKNKKSLIDKIKKKIF